MRSGADDLGSRGTNAVPGSARCRSSTKRAQVWSPIAARAGRAGELAPRARSGSSVSSHAHDLEHVGLRFDTRRFEPRHDELRVAVAREHQHREPFERHRLVAGEVRQVGADRQQQHVDAELVHARPRPRDARRRSSCRPSRGARRCSPRSCWRGTRRGRPRPSPRPSRCSRSRSLDEIHQRHRVAARRRDAVDRDLDDRPRARAASGTRGASCSNPGDAELVHRAVTVEPADAAGCPANAQNISVMRPFSRRCAIVSTPLPVRSRYATRCGVEHAERVVALRRHVDVTVVRRARSRRRTSAARATTRRGPA